MTNGGADYCFECIGLPSMMSEAFSSSRKVRSCVLFHRGACILSEYLLADMRERMPTTACEAHFAGASPISHPHVVVPRGYSLFTATMLFTKS